MDRTHATVIHADEAEPPPGPPTPGMDRRQLLNEGERWIGWIQTEPGIAGGWHHHGDRDSYVFILQGEIAIESGPGGRHRVVASKGDLVVNPGHMVHREVTGPAEPAQALVVRIGPGPLNVNVDGPDPDQPA